MRALFYDGQGRISIHQVKEAPAELPAFAHSPYVRTGVDTKRGLVVYEQQPELLRALLAAYQNKVELSLGQILTVYRPRAKGCQK
jgi:hypothetical protein